MQHNYTMKIKIRNSHWCVIFQRALLQSLGDNPTSPNLWRKKKRTWNESFKIDVPAVGEGLLVQMPFLCHMHNWLMQSYRGNCMVRCPQTRNLFKTWRQWNKRSVWNGCYSIADCFAAPNYAVRLIKNHCACNRTRPKYYAKSGHELTPKKWREGAASSLDHHCSQVLWNNHGSAPTTQDWKVPHSSVCSEDFEKKRTSTNG